MFLKTFVSHVLISILIMVAFFIASLKKETINYNLVLLALFVLGSYLYFLSGYLVTKTKVVWYNYFSIAAIGILFWTFCFLTYTEVDEYKHVGVPTIWSFYELFAVLKTPLHHLDLGLSLSDNRLINNILEFTTPLFISFLQYWGGKTKLKKLALK